MFLKWFQGIEGRPEVKRIDERIAKEKEAQGINGM